MKLFGRLLLPVCALVALSSVGGVYAMWNYWQYPEAIHSGGTVGLSGFYYKTEEILPDDGAHDMNALAFVEYVIYDVKAGLNSKKGNAIFTQLKGRDDKLLHSQENITNANFDHIFSTTESTLLEFTMEYVSDTRINLYVYKDADIIEAQQKIEEAQSRGETLTVRIVAYQTVVERSAYGELDWEDKGSVKGLAQAVNDGFFYVVSPSTWVGVGGGDQIIAE